MEINSISREGKKHQKRKEEKGRKRKMREKKNCSRLNVSTDDYGGVSSHEPTERPWSRRTKATRASREQGNLASARIATALRVLIAKADLLRAVRLLMRRKWFLIPRIFSCISKTYGLQQLQVMPRESPPHVKKEINAVENKLQ